MTAPTQTPGSPPMKGEREYPIPAGYPVPVEHIPDMPIDHYHVLAFGELTPVLCRAMGVKAMGCAYCGEDMTLRLMRPPLGAAGVRGDKVGSTVWGEDVAPICPCCSHKPLCVHRGGERAGAPAAEAQP